MRWVIIGSEGMLGRDLVESLGSNNVLALSRRDCDITSQEQIDKWINNEDIVVNCAAYTAVDDAEKNEKLAFEINADGPRNLAQVCKEKKSKLVQISTDYVFSGNSLKPYTESEATNPTSVYGKSKAAGENYVQHILPGNHFIFRTAWLYGKHGNHFGKTILKLAHSKESINVVDDQVGQPTWTVDLVRKIIEVIEKNSASGIYHGTSSGQVSWFEYARKIFELANLDPKRINPVSSNEFIRPAPRPSFSVLSHDSFNKTGINPIRKWDEALAQAFQDGVFSV